MPMHGNGLTKLMEECGELVQIAAKKSAYINTDRHPDGMGSLRTRLENEIADVLAACTFVISVFKLRQTRIDKRVARNSRPSLAGTVPKFEQHLCPKDSRYTKPFA